MGSPVETGLNPSVRPAAPSWTVWGLAAAVVILVASSAGLAIWAWRDRTISSPSSLARLTITLPSGQTLEKGRFPPMAVSPDGKLLVYAASVSGGRTNLFMRPLDELTARAIPATEGASAPFFSPDGRWLAFYADGLLKKVSVAGGVPLTICEAPPVWTAAWGANDRIVFATTLASSGLWLVSANGGEPMQITTPKSDEAQHGYPQILPDGTHVLFSVRRRNAWYLALLALNSSDWQLLGNGRVIGEGAQYLTHRTSYLRAIRRIDCHAIRSVERQPRPTSCPTPRTRRDLAVRRDLLCCCGGCGNPRLPSGEHDGGQSDVVARRSGRPVGSVG